MIVRKTNPRAGRYPRAGTGAGSSTGPAPKSHNTIGRHSPSFSEAGDKFGDDLANKPSARIFIETEIDGRVDLFQFIPVRPFHGGRYGD